MPIEGNVCEDKLLTFIIKSSDREMDESYQNLLYLCFMGNTVLKIISEKKTVIWMQILIGNSGHGLTVKLVGVYYLFLSMQIR